MCSIYLPPEGVLELDRGNGIHSVGLSTFVYALFFFWGGVGGGGIVLSVFLRHADSDCTFCIFKLFLE